MRVYSCFISWTLVLQEKFVQHYWWGEVLTKCTSRAGEGFTNFGSWDDKKRSESVVFQFSSLPTVVTSRIGSTMHVCQAEHSYERDITKKVYKYASKRAREEYQALTRDARRVLKHNGVAKDAFEKQGHPPILRLSAAPKRSISSGLCEVELLQGLEAIRHHLDFDITRARALSNKNAHRNYRRKRQQVKKLQAQLSARVCQSNVPHANSDVIPEHGGQNADFKNKSFVLSPEQWASQKQPACELVREAIMDEFWRQTIRKQRKLREFCPRNSIGQYQHTHVPCFQVSGKNNFTSRNNRYEVLANEAPAPRADELRHQLEQMQHHIRGMQRQLHGQGQERSRFNGQHPRRTSHDLPPSHGSSSTSSRYHTSTPAPSHGYHRGRRYPPPETRGYKPQWKVKTPPRNSGPPSHESQRLASLSQHDARATMRWEQRTLARATPFTNMAPRVPSA